VHAAIWSAVSQNIPFLFHEFPALGWISAALLIVFIVVFVARFRSTKGFSRRK
jgi:hypothetical protein